MTAFEHVILLLSFVYALALAHLLSGSAALIRARARVKFSWFHAAWMLNALVIIVANWISFFDMRGLRSWNTRLILFTLAIAVSNYVQAALVCMDMPAQGPVDMAGFHVAQSRAYIAGFIASVLTALLANAILGNAFNITQWMSQNVVVVPMLGVGIFAFIWNRGWPQAAALVALAALWAIYFLDLQSALK